MVLAATIMPDHVHALCELGHRLTLSQLTSKLKNAVRSSTGSSVSWQENFFDHRVRARPESERFAFYIFMNPYSERLIPLVQTWPGWFCPDPARWEFLSKLNPDGTPPPEWLAEARRFTSTLPAGAD